MPLNTYAAADVERKSEENKKKKKIKQKFFLFEKRCPSHQTGSGEDGPFRFQPLVGTTTCRRAFVSLTSIQGKQKMTC
jgi:hypothetical protein